MKVEVDVSDGGLHLSFEYRPAYIHRSSNGYQLPIPAYAYVWLGDELRLGGPAAEVMGLLSDALSDCQSEMDRCRESEAYEDEEVIV
jgi:hypothetical protein